jgi:hypothetical protein
MKREQAKKLLPVIQAYAEGKEMQLCNDGEWQDAKYQIPFDNITPDEIRVKPEPTYRPFLSAKDCFEEMKKHKPFGWLKDHIGYTQITAVSDSDDRRVKIICHIDDQDLDEKMIAGSYTFADGEPFGVKED